MLLLVLLTRADLPLTLDVSIDLEKSTGFEIPAEGIVQISTLCREMELKI